MDVSAPILAGIAGTVHVGMDKGLIKTAIISAVSRQLLLMAVLFVISIAIAYAFVKRISQPLNELSRYAAQLAEKDFDAELRVRSSDEIGLLAKTMQNMAHDLNKSYEELEAKVQERTAELSVAKNSAEQSLATLQVAQKQLVESEKMAALGGLVAGIAHEINTPVGVSITAASHLQEKMKELETGFKAGTIKKAELEKFLATSGETLVITMTNLNRAAELIASFKQVAVDQSSEDRRTFNFKNYLNEILLSLKHEYKRTSHRIEITGADDLEIDSYPGAFSQIVTNLLMNSLIHAYDPETEGSIRFDIRRENGSAVLRYSDNGKGIPPENLGRIFEPFFTTRRGKGGSGLGMHIVYNLVTTKLNGAINCASEVGKGTTFTVTFPVNAGGQS
jgi:signal transduction histidine kinase